VGSERAVASAVTCSRSMRISKKSPVATPRRCSAAVARKATKQKGLKQRQWAVGAKESERKRERKKRIKDEIKNSGIMKEESTLWIAQLPDDHRPEGAATFIQEDVALEQQYLGRLQLRMCKRVFRTARQRPEGGTTLMQEDD
jgi:hypothetical protein